MDFSSADVPISRETWAPRSPPARPRDTAQPPPPSGPSSTAAYPPASSSSNYQSNDAPSSAHYQPPLPGGSQTDDYPRGNGYDSGPGASSRYAPSSGAYVPPHRVVERQRGPDANIPRRPATAPQAEANNVLGVFGLSVRTRERDLEDEFGKYGDVEKVVIVYDQRTERSRGFGFITMRKTEHAESAIKNLNGYNLHGRVIRVDFSATQKAHNPTPGQYMGEKKPIYGFDDRYRGRYGADRDGYPDRGDSRRGYDRDRDYDRRDRDRDSRDYRPRRDHDDPYGGRSRRDDDRDRSRDRERRRSPSPRRRERSPDRRPPPPRDYDTVPRGDSAPRH